MKNKYLQPGILWGQHRTSELLAMGVKEKLENDPDIEGIPFIEFEKWGQDDYIERLYRQKEALEQGETEESYDEKWRLQTKPMLREYEKELRQNHGPFLFNLHDGCKVNGYLTADIEFWIPNYINEDKKLGQLLKNIGEEKGLEIKPLYFHSNPQDKIKINSPENIVVELMTPQPEGWLNYPNEEVKNLANKFDPLSNEFFVYKNLDKSNPLYAETIEKYSTFLKEAILRSRDLELTQKQ